jgi:hypothetical protein
MTAARPGPWKVYITAVQSPVEFAARCSKVFAPRRGELLGTSCAKLLIPQRVKFALWRCKVFATWRGKFFTDDAVNPTFVPP